MAFNELSPGEAERLAMLAEECGEAVQAIGKILRHGYESENPVRPSGFDNRGELEKEIGDLDCIVNMMQIAGDITASEVMRYSREKSEKIRKYLHHQGATPEPPTGEKNG